MKQQNKLIFDFTKSLNLFLFVLGVTFTLSSCGKKESEFDASGTFEATEVMFSAEVSGKILQFNIEEGQQVDSLQLLGVIDSTQLYLKKQQLQASIKAVKSRKPDMNKQIAALEQQIATVRSEKNRVENLVKANVANTKQLDDVNAQIAVLEKQLVATKSSISTTTESILGETEALNSQKMQIEDQLNKCRITSPTNGVILEKYAEAGELAVAGKPLFKVGNLQNMIMRAYITANQLTKLKTGQKVKVFSDFGEKDYKEYEGEVTYISDQAEFTPKTILTRDERANQVYAVKIKVVNDGYLKNGMYGHIKF
jgi:HlyD family secretion protein